MQQRKSVRALTLGTLLLVPFAAATSMAAQNATADWNRIALQTIIVNGGKTPTVSPVYLAYTEVAMYDAATSIDRRYTAFAVKVPASRRASVDASVIAAAHDVLKHYFPLQGSALDVAQASSLAALGTSPPVNKGVIVGRQVAARWIAIRANDGVEGPTTFVPGHGPGIWELTPPFLPPASPWQQDFTPFTMTSSRQFLFDIDAPPELGSQLWARDFNITRQFGALTGSLRTPSQTEIGLFWSDNPSLQYGRALLGLIAQQRLSTSDSARLLAMVGVAFSDSLTACMTAKYHYAFWRPYTAIRAADTDGNPSTDIDPNWLPLVVTPPHPEYPAAHGCATAALATTLRAFFHEDRIQFVVDSNVTHTTHVFTGLKDLVAEVDMARVFGGMHYVHSVLQGNRLGVLVARQAARQHFRPIRREDDARGDH